MDDGNPSVYVVYVVTCLHALSSSLSCNQTFIEDGNPDTTSDPPGLINFEKRRKVAMVIDKIRL